MSAETHVAPSVVGPHAGREVRFYSDEIEIKAEGELDVFEVTANAGNEPPMHVHDREDETFFVLEGTVTVYLGDEVIRAEPGTYAVLPRGVPHTFAVESGTARLLVTASPGGFVQMFDAVQAEFGGDMPERPAPEHVPALGAVLADFGIAIVGPNPSAI